MTMNIYHVYSLFTSRAKSGTPHCSDMIWHGIVGASHGWNGCSLLLKTLSSKTITLADFLYQGPSRDVPCMATQHPVSDIFHFSTNSLHSLSSLATPFHLPTSIWNAAVPPQSFIIIYSCRSTFSKLHNILLLLIFKCIMYKKVHWGQLPHVALFNS